mmetsp:Transcript_31047/g.54518  ORF Transcript_31047/g.54518 Transcript_31047/m.54518 type:complete len:117 (+) Transcript_31047:167-517(+)
MTYYGDVAAAGDVFMHHASFMHRPNDRIIPFRLSSLVLLRKPPSDRVVTQNSLNKITNAFIDNISGFTQDSPFSQPHRSRRKSSLISLLRHNTIFGDNLLLFEHQPVALDATSISR